jgi:phenylalanyl-tRNA synthetase alpha chain
MTDESTHDLETLAARARAAVGACSSLAGIDELKVEFFGKKGSITAQLKSLGALAPDARREAGARINAVRDEIGDLMAARQTELEQAEL